jgi:hypothetical protein
VVDGQTPPTGGQEFGETYPILGPPVNVIRIIIYTENIRRASPVHSDAVTIDSFDDSKTRQTIGHEIGHGIAIQHWIYNPNIPSRLSVMVAEYFPYTTNPNDPAWNNIPHSYHPDDVSQIRLR